MRQKYSDNSLVEPVYNRLYRLKDKKQEDDTQSSHSVRGRTMDRSELKRHLESLLRPKKNDYQSRKS